MVRLIQFPINQMLCFDICFDIYLLRGFEKSVIDVIIANTGPVQWNDPDMVKIFYFRHIYQFDVIVMI